MKQLAFSAVRSANFGLELITATTFVLELVVEVSTDHITDRHFRHGARILRWRTDKEPHDCTMDQIERR
jgi:ATP-dependent DNA ligase